MSCCYGNPVEASGQIIEWLNEVRIDLDKESVIRLLKHKANKLVLDISKSDYDSKLLLTIASNCHIENGKDFSELRREVFGNRIRDERTGDEIIQDTFKKRNIRIVQ